MKTTSIISRENVLCNVLNITEECAALANVYSQLSEYLTPTGDSFVPCVSIKKETENGQNQLTNESGMARYVSLQSFRSQLLILAAWHYRCNGEKALFV